MAAGYGAVVSDLGGWFAVRAFGVLGVGSAVSASVVPRAMVLIRCGCPAPVGVGRHF